MAAYRWRRVEPFVKTPLPVALPQARVALVTTAGLYRAGMDQPFRHVAGGNVSLRVLPHNAALHELLVGQTSDSFDRTPVESDRNVAFPIDRLRALVALGEIGEVSARHLSFNGSISAPGRLLRESAPRGARVFVQDQVDVALLVPV